MILSVACFTILLVTCISKPDSSFPIRFGEAAADKFKGGQGLMNIGVRRFRILGGGGAMFRILGGQGGQIPSRPMAS